MSSNTASPLTDSNSVKGADIKDRWSKWKWGGNESKQSERSSQR